MDVVEALEQIDLFRGLNRDELAQIANICFEKKLHKSDILAPQGVVGNEIYIITEGFVEILIQELRDPTHRKVVANLGSGQIIGEMGLVDHGPRSATVRALEEPTIVKVITYQSFRDLCEHNTRIGYIIMSNLAADISFKLRRANMILK